MKQPGADRTEFLLTLTKWDKKTLGEVLTGHGSINYHMEKIRIVVLAIWNYCEQDEGTALNFVCSCPNPSGLSPRFLGKGFFTEESAHSLSLENVLRLAKACERRKQVVVE